MHDDINISGSVFDFTYIVFIKALGFKHDYFVPNINISVSSVAEEIYGIPTNDLFNAAEKRIHGIKLLGTTKAKQNKTKKGFFCFA